MGNSPRKRTGWLLTGIMVFVFISCIIPPLSSFAADDSWVVVPGSDPYWSTSGNWNLGYQPGATGATDNAILELSPTASSDATVIYNSQNNPTLGTVTVDGGNGYSLELEQSQGALTSTTQYIGYDGSGIYTQSVGANNIGSSSLSGNLYLGFNGGSNGTYNLSGDPTTSTLTVNGTEYIGYNGTGTFTQSGGTNAGRLFLGENSGSSGTYNLSDGQLLTPYEYIGFSGSGTFNQTGGTNEVGYEFELGSSSGSSGTYSLSDGQLRSSYEVVGFSGSGTFNQTGGTNTLTSVGQLILGSYMGGTGTYNLSGGQLIAFGENIIAGTFNQSGGSNSIGTRTSDPFPLYLGYNSGNNGTYNLSGDSTSTLTTGNEYIGYGGTGTFNQSGGSHTIGTTTSPSNLYLGYNSGSTGTYNLSGDPTTSTLTVNGNEYIGYNGTGTFNQSGGSHTVGGDLYLGYSAGSTGTYNLSGDPTTSTLTVNGTEYIGYNGTGTFTQSGGTNAGRLFLGENSGSSGTYNLSDGQLLTPWEYIGISGNGTFNQTGGTNYAGYDFGLGLSSGSSGTYNLSGGQLSSSMEEVGFSGSGTFNQTGGTNTLLSLGQLSLGSNSGGSGTYNLSGGQLIACGEYINAGTFNQSGGSNYIGHGSEPFSLYLGGNSGSSGTYNLSGDSTSTLTAGNEYIGYGGTGTFNQSGGSHTIGTTTSPSNLYLGYNSGSTGTYNLSGDPTTSTLTVNGDEYIGYNGIGTFNQSGGAHTVTGALTISANPGVSSGIYNLSGGTLTVNGGITNNDTLNYSGGTLTANLTNNGNVSLSGSGTRTVNGDVTNNGTFKVTNTIAQYTGTFTNNGAYVSDPAINHFINLVIGQTGYLQGGTSDQFLISGYFQNMSTSTLWNTSNALLGFDGGGQHSLFETGNFRWGTLDIFDGNSILLSGTGSLYLEHLIGLAFNPRNDTISNIWGNGLNIYYDAADNPLLDGHTYSLMGGGDLIAYNTNPTAPVPEPSTMLLLGAGLLGLAGFRKKLKK